MEHLIPQLPHLATFGTFIVADAWTDGMGKVKTIYTEVAPYLIGAVWFATGVDMWMSQRGIKQHLGIAGLASVILGGADAIASTIK